MSEVLSGRVSKHKRDRRVKNSTVLRIMAIMQEGNSEVPKEFLETGRTGRRNAMPDILHPQGAEVSTADLPGRLQQLTATENPITLPDMEILPVSSRSSSVCAATKPKKRSVWSSDTECPQPGPSNNEVAVGTKPSEKPTEKDSPHS